MKSIKLTAFCSLILSGFVFLSSCEREAEDKKNVNFQKSGVVLSGSQEIPANPSPALGTMDISYSKDTRILNYKVTWTGLLDSVSNMHIHGLAPIGFSAGVVHNIVTATNGLFPLRTNGKLTFTKTGTLSGTLLADGVVVKEQDLLNGMYYVNIHTSAYPGGEIRGQIKFD